jgi:hypothetical protein
MNVCVCTLALVTQHAKRIFSAPYYIVICSLSGCTIFFHTILQMSRFSKKRKLTDHNMCVLIFSRSFV